MINGPLSRLIKEHSFLAEGCLAMNILSEHGKISDLAMAPEDVCHTDQKASVAWLCIELGLDYPKDPIGVLPSGPKPYRE